MSQYCWATDPPEERFANGTCGGENIVNWEDPSRIDSRRAVDEFPKLILLFGFLYVLPHYYWEYFCGGTLAGYLTHLKNLILAIEEKCKTIPTDGVYGGKDIEAAAIFDKDSSTFSTSTKYKRFWYADDFVLRLNGMKPRKPDPQLEVKG